MNLRKKREPGTAKEIAARLIEQAGGPKMVAARLDVSVTHVYALTDPALPDARLSLNQAMALTTEAAPAAAEALAFLAGGLFLPVPHGQGHVPALTGEAAKRFGEMMGEIVRDIADGKIDGAEACAAIARLHEVLRPLAALLAELEAIRGGKG